MDFFKTDLTDSQWAIIEKLIGDTRKRQYSLRLVCNLLFYLLKTGCQWRMLPARGISWQVVYYYFRKWQRQGVLEQLHEFLYARRRKEKKLKAFPSTAVIDSQSVKTALAQQEVGYDAGKKVKGRKRHLLVDTQGLLLSVRVSKAAEADRKGAKALFQAADQMQISNLKKVYADGGYRGKIIEELKEQFGFQLSIVAKKAGPFKVLPKRWVVERTFAWLDKCRRLSKDYEKLTTTSEAFIILAMCRLMLNYYKT